MINESLNVSRETSTVDTILTQIKKQADQNKLAHSYMFEGGNADRRFEFALKMACIILCDNNHFDTQTPQNTTNNDFSSSTCRKIMQLKHPDVHIFGDQLTEAGYISVDTARDIKKQACMLPNEAEKKVFIIKNADNFNIQAQNALLKIFEEPPSYVVFILLCSHKSSFLPTTLSRMVVYRLKETSKEETAHEIKNRFNIENRDHALAVSGYMTSIPSTQMDNAMIKNVINGYEIGKEFFSLGGNCRLISILPSERDQLIVVLNVLSMIARDLLCLKHSENNTVIITPDQDWQRSCGRLSTIRLTGYYDVFSDCAYKLEKYANINSVLSTLSFINT